MADTAVLNGIPTFVPFTDQSTDANNFQKFPSNTPASQKVTRGDASDATDYSAAANGAASATTNKQEEKLPHAAIRSEDREEPLSMSWWPIPDDLMMAAEDRFSSEYNASKLPARPKTKRQPSIFKKLETRLAGYMHPHHNKAATSPGGDTVTDTRSTTTQAPSDTLYHVLLTTSHLEKDINSAVQGLRICGTFTSLPAAKAAAHTCIFSLGYEAEWFSNFRTQHDLELIDHDESRIVEATGPGGEVFAVDIATVPNSAGLVSRGSSGRVTMPLFHVVQTVVHYGSDSSGESRDTIVKGSFAEYKRAREVAHELLLWFEEGIEKSTYVQYEEAGEEETDCGYGENVVVHAVGNQGENYLVSVLVEDGVESDRIREAAERMRE
jgi:hypothetical protein